MCVGASRLKIVDGKIVRKTDAEYEADLAAEEAKRLARVKIQMGPIGKPERRKIIEPLSEPANEPVEEPAAPAVAPTPEREPEEVPA